MTMDVFAISIFLCLLYSCEANKGTRYIIVEDDLVNDLFRNRDIQHKQSRPELSHLDKTKVKIGLTISHILELNEKTETMAVNAFLRLVWNDNSLTWDPAKYKGLTSINIPADFIWKPDIMLWNSADSSENAIYQHSLAILTSDGLVTWVPPTTLNATCALDLSRFPFDRHVCRIILGSWTYSGNEIELSLHKYEVGAHEESKNNSLVEFDEDNPAHDEWKVINSKAWVESRIYKCCPELYHSAHFELTLRRRAPYYQLTVLTPNLVAIAIILSLFWLPPSAPEKISVGCFAILFLLIQVCYCYHTIPRNGSSVPCIVVLSAIALLFGALSLFVAIFTINIARTRTTKNIPEFIENILTNQLNSVLCLGSYKSKSQPTPKASSECDDASQATAKNMSAAGYGWEMYAAAVDRIFFFIYCLIFVISIFTLALN